MPKYNITVDLVGEDGNALVLIGKVAKALKRHGVPQDEVKAFRDEAMSGDYDNVIATCAKWVEVE